MSSSSDIKITQQRAARPPPITLGINIEKPKFSQYATLSKRLESFKDWEANSPVDKQSLAEAGLVYTGIGDSVRCYFCGGGLRNWERGDVPMEEHAKYYSKCPHIMLVKGQDYAEKVKRGEKTDNNETDNARGASDPGKTDHLESAAAMSCIDMGYSRDLVKKAIDIYISKHDGATDFKGADLCTILFDIEDNVDEPHVEEMINGCSVDDDEQLEPLENLREENQRLKESQVCKICLDSRADVIFLPCGHMVSCPQCAPALVKCPVCRKFVNGHIKAFFATTRASGQN